MKMHSKILVLSLFLFPVIWAFAPHKEKKNINNVPSTTEIKWISFEEAMVLSQKEPRKVIIDVFTDWCGWCKKMDVATFQHPVIAAYVSEKYYAVRLNAEQTAPIKVGDRTYKFIPGPEGRRGYHELAAELLGNKMSYPTIVFLDDNFNLIQALSGYRGPEDIEPIIKFFGSNAYANQSWEIFSKDFKSAF